MKITVLKDIDFAKDVLVKKDKLLRWSREQKEKKKQEKLRLNKVALTGRKVIDVIDHYLVRSSDGTHWHTVDKKLSSCKEPDGKLCIAYKFRRTCGHIKSAERYIKENAPVITKSVQELIDYLSDKGWTRYLDLIEQGFKDNQIDLALSTYAIVDHPKNKGLYHILA